MNTQTGPRSVVITGASSGIGHACALRLDRAGLRVFAGVRQEADAEALRRQASDRLTLSSSTLRCPNRSPLPGGPSRLP